MKIRLSHESGSVLGTCLCSVAIMGITLAAYLDLVSAQNTSVARSQSWNSAVPIIEFGVEEALAHLYQNGTNLAVDGWTLSPDGFYKFRSVGDGWAYVTISNVNPPVIYSRGFAPVPLKSGAYVDRTVRVRTQANSLFSKGMLTRGQITFNGNGLVDSFDSADPLYSTNRTYTATKRKANGSVASNAGLVNVVLTGNSSIYGNLATGPGGSIGIGPGGKVGDLAWMADPTKTGIQPGASKDDMNVAFPDVTAPFAVGSPMGGDATYQYVASSSGNYQIPSLTGSLWVKSNVNATILIDGNISLTGQKKIQIDPGGSLQIYMKGASAKIGGNGLVNKGGSSTNFFFWGLPTNTELTVSGNGTFSGIIYAPTADFTMNGGGSTTEDIIGASVSNTARINGHFQFHYDENVGRLNLGRGFVATSWDEL